MSDVSIFDEELGRTRPMTPAEREVTEGWRAERIARNERELEAAEQEAITGATITFGNGLVLDADGIHESAEIRAWNDEYALRVIRLDTDVSGLPLHDHDIDPRGTE